MESPGSVESNILPCGTKLDEHDNNDYQDDLINQLTVAGSAGVAAAAAILSSKKSHHNYRFETSPAVRKRQQTRILRKIKELVDEFAGRCGQQICVVCCGSSKSSKPNSIQIFGTHPLENVLRNQKSTILVELENSLQNDVVEHRQQHHHQQLQHDNNNKQFELPPLVIDGIPTSLDQMTQCQLRMFIPLLLKYSTGRGKPGWGRNECKPEWWPADLPWANIRVDPRDEEAKKKSPWTEVLKEVIRNCYKYHGREDLLHKFANNESPANKKQKLISKMPTKINCSKLPIIQNMKSSEEMIMQTSSVENISTSEQVLNENIVPPTSSFTLLQQIQNIDGSVSLVAVESGVNIVRVIDTSRENEHLINDQFLNASSSLNNSDVKSEHINNGKANLFSNSNLGGSPILITNDNDSIGNLTTLRNSVIQMNSYPNLWNNFGTDQQQNSSASNNLSNDIQMVISNESNIANEELIEESDDDDNEISEQIIELACLNKGRRSSSNFNESLDASENSSDKILQTRPKRYRWKIVKE